MTDWCVGLTDDPIYVRAQRGNPVDWRHTKFDSEAEAHAWIKSFGHGPMPTTGWRYGYWYKLSGGTT
jgi:hypothetical protein